MCEPATRLRWIATAATIALAVMPARAQSQSSAELETRYRAARTSATVIRRAADSVRHAVEKQLPPDSTRVGGLTIRYSQRNIGAQLRPMLDAAAAAAASVADSEYGDAARDPRVEAQIVVDRSSQTWSGAPWFEAVSMSLIAAPGRSEVVRAPFTTAKLADAFLKLVGTAATRGVEQNIVAWAGYWTPSGVIRKDYLEDAAVNLATSPSSVARACYSGSISSCESALGLTVLRDTLREWYSPDGWRVLVENWNISKSSSFYDDVSKCTEQRIAATCEVLARSRPIPPPLVMATRSTLMGLAIERGGRGGFVRLLSAKGPPVDALALTAGESIDALVSDWRARVLAALPKSGSLPVSETVFLLGWAIVFGAASTMRRPS